MSFNSSATINAQQYLLESFNDVINFRVSIVGDESVGKSSLVYKLTARNYIEDQVNTGIAANFTHTTIIKKEIVMFDVWDTAGQPQFRKFISYYYKDADAIIVMYDITSKESFLHAKGLVFDVLRKGSEDNIIALVGNKLDLENGREVSTEEGEEFCQQTQTLFYETSTKSEVCVNRLFRNLFYFRYGKKTKESRKWRLSAPF